MSKLIFGCGYLGLRVARRWLDARETVHVVNRSPQRAQELAQAGLHPLVADVTRRETLGNLPEAQTVLFAVGHDRTTGNSIEDVYSGGMKNVLAALPACVERLIYISTIGVYGSAGGDWVDESTPPNPRRAGGRASLAAEMHLANHPVGNNSIVLRLAGLYGPGRIPHLDKLRAGEPIAAPSAGWLNLIHVDDAATAVLAAESWNPPQGDEGPHIFCVSDGQPVVRANYYREVARCIGAAAPEFVDPDPDLPAAQRASANRRISCEKMRAQLGVELAYPSYREALAAIQSDEAR